MGENDLNNLHIYDEVADRWWSDEVRWIRTLKNLVPGRMAYFSDFTGWEGTRVLDLGCAGGFMSEALADKGAKVTAIDPAAAAISAARMHAAKTGRIIDYHEGVGENLRFPAGDFDVVVCVDVLEHVDDLARVVGEVARVLRPGGLFLFDTINRNALAKFVTITLAENVLKLLPKGTHDPAKFIRPGELVAVLEKAGLAAGKFTGLGPRGITPQGDFTFGRMPTTAVIYMGTARKG